jgi:uncharacterized protein (TIGR00369 family)
MKKGRMRTSSGRKDAGAEKSELVEMVRARMRESEATRHLEIDVESVGNGQATFVMDVQPKHKQIHGVVHGGFLAALADTTAAIAAYSTLAKGTEIATVELKINFLEPVPGGKIRAEGRVLRTGRNFVVTECEIYNESGSMAAKALLTFGAIAGHTLEGSGEKTTQSR